MDKETVYLRAEYFFQNLCMDIRIFFIAIISN